VGVYDTSRLAARAYTVVQDYLREYRGSNSTVSKETPKEELAKIFASARKAADDAVKELQNQIKNEEGSSKKGAAKASPKSASQSTTKDFAEV